MVEKRAYINCPIMLPYTVTHVELVQLDLVNFSVILGMIVCMSFLLQLIVQHELSSLIFQNELHLE